MGSTPQTLLGRALDPEVEPPDDALSTRILDAALALAAASGLRHLTIDEVARRARVGRMTVYRRFGDKQRLVEALVVRESRRCLAELDAAIGPQAPIEDQIAEGFVTSMRLAREHPLLNRLARVEPESLLAALTEDGDAVFSAARAFVAARLRASQRAGVVGELDVEAAAELLVRLAFSFVLIQESVLPLGDEAATRETARRLIAPVLSGWREAQGAAGETCG
ncbi:MAG TPA: TetR/AcrR family transcriptional regulator [Solirubrobacteraceae bacterium]|jgi:AcrR family transcriptional regulator|nr:TetR/AcrR family transcriptional regulator [Solirubrobacteraceae bacterium]